jgi:uncharacterized membrane protein
MQQSNSSNATKNIVPMSAKVKRYRYIALFGHIGLLIWMLIWYLGLTNAREYSISFIFVMYLLPLLFPLHGIIKAKPYTHAWSCFVVLWYFMHAVTTMYVEPAYLLHAIIEMIFVISMFVGCAMYARLRGQELGAGLPKLSKVMADEKSVFERSVENENKTT